MNDYIQKYGQNAIQAYKKSLRMSESLQKNKQSSPFKQQSHLIPKKSLSKRSLKSSLTKRNQSRTNLAHSKSIKHNKTKIQEQHRRKAGSFIQSTKKQSNPLVLNGFSHTFNKLNNNPNKKKLVITSQTPKSVTPKLHINLNLNKNVDSYKQTLNLDNIKQKDKLTQRIHHRSSSKKKHIQKCSTSNSKLPKRSFLGIIDGRLQDMLSNTKTTFKNLTRNLVDCFDIILSNQEDQKLRRVFFLIKQTVYKMSSIGEKYKQKWNKTKEKINHLQKLHSAYIGSQNNGPYSISAINQSKSRPKLEPSHITSQSNKKQKPSIQTIIMNQNYDLRRKVHKLQKQLEYFMSQQASMNNVFGKYKNSQSQLRLGSGSIYQQGIFQNFQSLKKSKNGSLNKITNRRSSQNLLSSQQNQNYFTKGYERQNGRFDVQKRLSFDPNYLNDHQSQSNQQNSNQKNIKIKKSEQYAYNIQKGNHIKSSNKREQVEQLSQQQDSDNQQQQ